MSSVRCATAAGLTAAALFGASTPTAKLLVPNVGALMLAGLLYLGAGLGLMALAPFRRSDEVPVRRRDLRSLVPMILAGGVVGPVLLVVGLARTSGVAASLLLNLEAPFTMALSAVAFRDQLGGREIFGATVVLVGAAALGFAPGPLRGDSSGVIAIAAACAAWALDNNLAQRLALRDPVSVARAKTVPAGMLSVGLALAFGESLPDAYVIIGALVVGAAGYGASLVLHLMAIRGIGAARQAALLATAPFIGAIVSVPLLGERLGLREAAGGALMAFGLRTILRARHAHAHVHEAGEHEHVHVHDEHHQHAHVGDITEPHSHVHSHAALVHDHPHLPDPHHRHAH